MSDTELIAELHKSLEDKTILLMKANQEIERLTENRNSLVKALLEITTYDPSDGQCNSGYSCKYIAEQAIVAIEGGEP